VKDHAFESPEEEREREAVDAAAEEAAADSIYCKRCSCWHTARRISRHVLVAECPRLLDDRLLTMLEPSDGFGR